jgi:hypothetical protein
MRAEFGYPWVSHSGVVTSKAVEGRTGGGRDLTRVTVTHPATPRQVLVFEGELARFASGFRPGDTLTVMNGLDNRAADRAWDIYVQQCFVPLGGRSHGQGVLRETTFDRPPPAAAELRQAFGPEGREQDLAHAATVYLMERGIEPRLQLDPRFSGSFGVPRGEGGRDLDALYRQEQELWASRYLPSDRRLVFTEWPIDGLAYHQVRRDEHACYVSVGQDLSLAKQAQLVRGFARMPQEVQLVAAFAGTSRGDRLGRELAELCPDRVISRKSPGSARGWADVAEAMAPGRTPPSADRRAAELER